MMNRAKSFKYFVFGFFLIFLSFVIISIQMLDEGSHNHEMMLVLDDFEEDYDMNYETDDRNIKGKHYHGKGGNEEAMSQPINSPILLWWTPFTGERGRVKRCGKVECFFTIDRHFQDHPNTMAFLFYGTDLQPANLPLPRKPQHDWALLHEESPKNQYLFSHKEVMELFNHTSTFKRESNVPLHTHWLDSLDKITSTKYVVSTKQKNKLRSELPLVNYLYSDCNTPSDRDHFVQMMQRLTPVDALGSCEHNKDLPPHLRNAVQTMFHEDLYSILSQYKFTLAMENAVCDDYITEKFWRPFMLGSVPIVLGSSKIKEFLPSNHSAILVDDFANMRELVDYLKKLDADDKLYDEYLSFKKTGVTNNNLKKLMVERVYGARSTGYGHVSWVDSFECMVCERIHNNLEREVSNKPPLHYQANVEHYGCPKPKRFADDDGQGNLKRVDNDWWATEWLSAKYQATALKQLLHLNVPFTKKMLNNLTMDLYESDKNRS